MPSQESYGPIKAVIGERSPLKKKGKKAAYGNGPEGQWSSSAESKEERKSLEGKVRLCQSGGLKAKGGIEGTGQTLG